MREEDIRKRELLDRYLELVRDDVEALFRDHSQFEPIPCPACGGSSLKPEFQKLDFHYVSCENCQTLFVTPRPSAALLNQFYADSPSTHFWINDFFKPMASARQEKIFRPRAQDIARRFGSDPGWTIGDIGAGFGLFLKELSQEWPASRMVAIEPSREQAAICKSLGFDVIECPLEDMSPEHIRFDLLVAFELMEHLHNPGAFLARVIQLLKPGGWFILTTLNVHGFDIQVLWSSSKSVNPPHHLNFFNPESLAELLTQRGFQVAEILTPGRLDYDIVEGMIRREHATVDRFWTLVANMASPVAKAELQDWITSSGFSSHMSIYARKPL